MEAFHTILENGNIIDLTFEEYQKVKHMLYFCEECKCDHVDIEFTFEEVLDKIKD